MRSAITIAACVLLGGCGLVHHPEGMTEGERASALAGLDDACVAEGWCTDDVSYRFTDLACEGDRSECQLSFDATIDGRLRHDTVDVRGHSQILEGTDVHPSFEAAVGRALAARRR